MLSKKNIGSLVLTGTLIGTFTGCGQTDPQLTNILNNANSFMNKKNYLNAIKQYQIAINKTPDNDELKVKLENAKTLYVKSSLERLNYDYSNIRLKSIDTISQFTNKSFNLKQYTNNKTIDSYNKFNQLLLSDKQITNSKISKIKNSIDKSIVNNNIDNAATNLVSLLKFDNNIKATDYYISVNQKIDIFYLNKIKKALIENNLDSAKEKYNKYISFQLGTDTTSVMKKMIIDHETIHNLINASYQLVLENDVDSALENVKLLKTYDIKNKNLKKRIKQLASKIAKEYLEQAEEYMEANRVSDAYFVLVKASTIKSSVKYTSIGKIILDNLYDHAKNFNDVGLIGNAYALYTYIQNIDANFKSTFVLHRDIKDKLLQRNILKLAVSEFVTPNMDSSSGTRFTASLTSQLFKSSNKDLKVIERNRLKLILDELKLRETGNLETLAQRGKIKGINVFVFGDIVESSVEPQRVESTVSKRVQNGTRKINNNMYMMYMMATPEKQAKMGKVPAQFIEEPIFETIYFKKGEIKKTANLIVSVRIVDIEKGEIIAAKTLESQKIESDKYNDGVEHAGIFSDPEQIASDKTIINELHKDMINQITKFVLKPFENREIQTIEKIDFNIQRREYNKAMESLIDTALISEIKNESLDATIKEQKDFLFREIIR